MSRLWVGCMSAAVLVIATGCGAGERAVPVPASSPATVEQRARDSVTAAYVDAIVASGEGDTELSAAERQCYAERSVEIIGVDAYKTEGITPDGP